MEKLSEGGRDWALNAMATTTANTSEMRHRLARFTPTIYASSQPSSMLVDANGAFSELSRIGIVPRARFENPNRDI